MFCFFFHLFICLFHSLYKKDEEEGAAERNRKAAQDDGGLGG